MDLQTILGLLARHGLTVAGGMLAHDGIIGASGQEQFVGAGMALLGIGWSWYEKRGRALLLAEIDRLRRASGRAAVAMLALMLAGGYMGDLHAANLSPVLKAPIAAKAAPDCTQLDCSGWIAGVNIMGSGSNADILGSGINGSVFAGGGLVGFDGGGQLWNGKFFGGFLASIDYDANMSGVLPNQGRVLGMVLVQAGVGLSGIFAPSSTSAPVGIPDKIAAALVSPYFNFGAAIRQRGDAWVTGAGAEFDLSSAWLLRLDYLHLDYSHGQAAAGLGGVVSPSSVENLVKATLLRRFDGRFFGS